MPSTEQVKGALTECLPLHLVLWGVVAVLLSWQHFEQDKANRVTLAVLRGKDWEGTGKKRDTLESRLYILPQSLEIRATGLKCWSSGHEHVLLLLERSKFVPRSCIK